MAGSHINSMKIKYFLLLSLLSISAILFSCGNDPSSVKVRNWHILHDDSGSLEEISAADNWMPVDIPSTFKLAYTPEKKFRYVWLRGEFEISGDPSIYYGVETGRIRVRDEIYINKEPVGALPEEEIVWNPLPRNYVFPPGVLKVGKNVMHVRLGIYGKYHGGIMGNVTIQKQNTFMRSSFYNTVLYEYVPIGMIFIFSSLVIPLIIVFIWNRKEKLPLYALLGASVYIIYSSAQLIPVTLISFESYTAVLMLLVPLFSVALMLFIQSIYRIYFSNLNRIIVPLNLLFIIIMILNRNNEYNYTIGFLLTNIIIVINIPYTAFVFYRLRKTNPDKFLVNLTGVMALLIAAVILFEYYAEYYGCIYGRIPSIYSPFVFFVAFAFLFSREIMKRRIHLEFLYNQLRNMDGREKGPSITETSEEKLKRVVKFINENFTSDISREGLAAAVEMNPNYMCSLFKSYTGSTLHDYISNLRVKEAVRLLENTDQKIIDIAFSVGFENSVTFNRVFKKITGKTPTEFRNTEES